MILFLVSLILFLTSLMNDFIPHESYDFIPYKFYDFIPHESYDFFPYESYFISH